MRIKKSNKDGKAAMFLDCEEWSNEFASKFTEEMREELVIGCHSLISQKIDLSFLVELQALRSLRINRGLRQLEPVTRCTQLKKLCITGFYQGRLYGVVITVFGDRFRQARSNW